MLNERNERELCYLVVIDSIEPIEGKDKVECARVGGWTIMVRKGQFESGDVGVYFEIDSKVPEKEPFDFLASKHYKIKTQRYRAGEGHFYSQGLLMHPSDFGWDVATEPVGGVRTDVVLDSNGKAHYVDDESRFLTKELGVVYAVAEDNKRKAKSVDKYTKMAQRHRKLFARAPYKWLMNRDWGKKLLFVFYGKKRDTRGWPSHICAKTDVERIQNMMWVLEDKHPYVASEKVDGSSCTIAAERTRFGKIRYYVCSRNVVFDDEDAKCFYDSNIYFEVYHKYNLKEKITQMLNDCHLDNIALQMEVYGEGVQKRTYSTKEHKAAVFHIVTNREKFPMEETVRLCEKYDIPHVPIIDTDYVFPDSLDELREYVEGAPSKIDGKEKEGIVFYDKTGQIYTKFVSLNYLMKYH